MFLKAIKRVFRQPLYIIFGAAVALSMFLISVLAPNFELVWQVLMSSQVGPGYKIHFIWTLVQGLGTSVIPLSAFTTVAISIFLGINIPMLVYMVKRNRLASQRVRGKGVSSSLGGIIGGSLGIGCAACGSLILAPVLASLGATGFLAFLPFRGSEFGLLGISLILFSIYILVKKINDPLVCPVE